MTHSVVGLHVALCVLQHKVLADLMIGLHIDRDFLRLAECRASPRGSTRYDHSSPAGWFPLECADPAARSRLEREPPVECALVTVSPQRLFMLYPRRASG